MTNQMECPRCNIALVAVERNANFSVAGIISVLLFFAGLATLLFNFIAAIIVLILAAIIGAMKSKRTVMVCPSCGNDIIKL